MVSAIVPTYLSLNVIPMPVVACIILNCHHAFETYDSPTHASSRINYVMILWKRINASEDSIQTLLSS